MHVDTLYDINYFHSTIFLLFLKNFEQPSVAPLILHRRGVGEGGGGGDEGV